MGAGYLLKYGNTVAYEPKDDRKSINKAKISMYTDAVSKFTFTMPPGNPIYDAVQLHDFDHPVRLWFDDEMLFCGYVTNITKSIYLEKTVTCVSDLQHLADVDIRIEDSPQANGRKRVYTAPELFAYCVNYYNDLVNPSLQFTIGHTIAAGAVGYYDSYSGKTVVDAVANTPTKILDVIKKSILDPYNCMLRVWYAPNSGSYTRYIGLYASPYTTSNQTIRFAENMTEFQDSLSSNDTYTGCYPVGGTHRTFHPTAGLNVHAGAAANKGSDLIYLVLDFPSEEKVEPGDTIAIGDYEYDVSEDRVLQPGVSMPIYIEPSLLEDIPYGTAGKYLVKGTPYEKATVTLNDMDNGVYFQNYMKRGGIIYDIQAVARYGLKTFAFNDSDLLIPKDLMSRAIAELDEKLAITNTIKVNGVDMALYMDGYTHLLAGQKVRVIAEPHGVDETMVVSSADLNFDDPGQTKYTLGFMPNSMTRLFKLATDGTQDVRDLLLYNLNDTVTQEFLGRLK